MASAVVSMVIGGIWYGPLFGKAFIKAQGWDKRSKEEQAAMMKGMTWNYVWQFFSSIVMFSVLSVVVYATVAPGVVGGMLIAFLLWLGFVVPVKFGDSLWGGKKMLFWLSIGNMLLTLLAGGAIIGVWR